MSRPLHGLIAWAARSTGASVPTQRRDETTGFGFVDMLHLM
jgi:hypothetical protein